MNKKKVYILEDRGVLFIQGTDATEFLQNLITNDISKVNENNSCFASLLTPQGKYLFDFLIIKHKNGFFLDCEKTNIEDLYKQLNIYKLRSKIEILNLSNEYVVAAISRDKFLNFENSDDVEGKTIKFREDPIFLDPRDKRLGARIIINLEKLYLSLKKLDLVIADCKDYYFLTSSLGIPQLNTNQLKNKIFGIECNFEELNGIDFKKGCYVGQENTARIKLKKKLTKRLFALSIISGSIKCDDVIKIGKTELGKVLIGGEYPFAIIKFVDGNFKFDQSFNCGNALVQIIKPKWF